MIFILTLKRKDNFELKTHKKYNRGLESVVFFIIYITSKNYRISSISDGADIFIFVCVFCAILRYSIALLKCRCEFSLTSAAAVLPTLPIAEPHKTLSPTATLFESARFE